MVRTIENRMNSRLALAILAMGLFIGLGSAALADGAAPLAVVVTPLRDAGGLSERGPDGRPLNLRYTDALFSYLSEPARGRLLVVRHASEVKAPAQVFTLEGDLSHVESDDLAGGPYLCTLRLFREASPEHPDHAQQPRRIVNQWAGWARTLRHLTGNLNRDQRVDQEGLLGELGKRVLAQMTALGKSETEHRQFAALVEQAAHLGRLEASVMATGAGFADAPAGQVKSGATYQVRVVAQDAGTAYLVATSAKGTPLTLLSPKMGSTIQVEPGRPMLLPAHLEAEEVTTPAERHFVVLVRRRAPAAEGSAAPAPAPQPGAEPAAVGNAPDDANPLAVQVLEGHPASATPETQEITRLLQMAGTDPAGTWLAQRLKLRILPR